MKLSGSTLCAMRQRIVKTKTPVTPAVLTAVDAAVYLGISRSALYRLLAERAIPFVQVTEGRRAFRRETLDQYLRDHEQVAVNS